MKTEKTWAEVIGGCLAVLAVPFVEAWLLMLVLGAVHSVIAAVPAVGFWTAFLLFIGLNMAVGYVRKLRRK